MPAVVACGGLSIEEMIWLARQAQGAGLWDAVWDIAQMALARGRTKTTLNLAGSLFRERWIMESERLLRESVERFSSPEKNPWGRVHLAATLRHQLRPHDGFEILKPAMRFCRDNEYACSVERALLEDMKGFRVWRMPRDKDVVPSLIDPLQLADTPSSSDE